MTNYITLAESDEGIRLVYDPADQEQPYGLEDTLNGSSDRYWMSQSILSALAAHRAGRSAGDPIVAASDITFNEGLMRLAAVHGKTVTFRYAKGDGSTIETRTLKPEHVLQAKDGHVTFTGYDPDRDEPRAYRTDRIKGEVTVG